MRDIGDGRLAALLGILGKAGYERKPSPIILEPYLEPSGPGEVVMVGNALVPEFYVCGPRGTEFRDACLLVRDAVKAFSPDCSVFLGRGVQEEFPKKVGSISTIVVYEDKPFAAIVMSVLAVKDGWLHAFLPEKGFFRIGEFAPDADSPEETAGDMLRRLGTDASLWAEEFQKTAVRLGYSDMDLGWLIGWFANAIENTCMVRRGSCRKDDPPKLDFPDIADAVRAANDSLAITVVARTDYPAALAESRTKFFGVAGEAPTLLLISAEAWQELVSRPSVWGNLFDPIADYELIIQGVVGRLMGILVMTDGFQHPTAQRLHQKAVLLRSDHVPRIVPRVSP